MTEKQWLRSADAEAMNEHFGDQLIERKARLVMFACCRRHPEFLEPTPVKTMAGLLAAHYADPQVPAEPFDGPDIRKAYKALEGYASDTDSGGLRGVAFGMVAAAEPVSVARRLNESFRYLVFSCVHDIAAGVSRRSTRKEAKAQALLYREIIGNPFRPVTAEPAWLTSTVVALARQMYATEDFSAMPILADALQDAGCEDATVLAHCRDTNQGHVRGCWVLDMLLADTLDAPPKRRPRKPAAKRASATTRRKRKA